MSFADVLAAARQLSAEEQAELVRTLADPVDLHSLARFEQGVTNPGTWAMTRWPVEASHENIVALQNALANSESEQ